MTTPQERQALLDPFTKELGTLFAAVQVGQCDAHEGFLRAADVIMRRDQVMRRIWQDDLAAQPEAGER